MNNAIALAAVDLGSNSFRLEIGSYEHHQIHRIEYLKETVRQGNGLDSNRNLTQESMERGWACLARFGERLRGFDPQHVRAVATQTLREAHNRDEFIERANELLGFPIEVITGEEEAALIYRGVISQLPASNENRLVIDIGGRSTEFVLGQASVVQSLASYRIGSVAWTLRYFPQGHLTPEAFETAEIAARAVLDEALDTFTPGSWDIAYASAGTANAVGDTLSANGFDPGVITRASLDWLQQQLLRAQHIDRIKLEGLKEDRRPIVAGGLSVLRAVFDLLGLERMVVAQGALRMGVLYELVNDEPTGDIHTASVLGLMQRFGVHSMHARHVAETAQQLWMQLHPQEATPPANLAWAGLLHEVGCRISRSNYHRHSAYILENSNAPGFAPAELAHLGQLVLGHRGKIKKMEAFMHLPANAEQLLCLRLAVVLCNNRRAPDMQGLQLQRNGKQLLLQTPPGWVQRFPLSAQLLREEAEAVGKTDWQLLLQLA
ncbi:MAG: Ppx/GppA phosphatase family protein [Comamonas sp.]|uniref:Ppx/GppA phosphatase family protein n=1 Tax=Comamonas sp. TaxID=34028 RepID=UPI002FCAA0CF